MSPGPVWLRRGAEGVATGACAGSHAVPVRGAAGARASADNLIAKLRVENQRLKEQLAQLAAGADGDDAEVLRREALARPVLKAKVAGSPVQGAQKLIRNVALHAEVCPQAGAPLAEWRRAQKSRRLGATGGGAVRCEVESVIPMVDDLMKSHSGRQPRGPCGGSGWQAAILELFLTVEAGREDIVLRADAAEFCPSSGYWSLLPPDAVEVGHRGVPDQEVPCSLTGGSCLENVTAEVVSGPVVPGDGLAVISPQQGPQCLEPEGRPRHSVSAAWWNARQYIAEIWLAPPQRVPVQSLRNSVRRGVLPVPGCELRPSVSVCSSEKPQGCTCKPAWAKSFRVCDGCWQIEMERCS